MNRLSEFSNLKAVPDGDNDLRDSLACAWRDDSAPRIVPSLLETIFVKPSVSPSETARSV